MLLSLRKNGLTSLFKEVRVFKVCNNFGQDGRTLHFPETFLPEGLEKGSQGVLGPLGPAGPKTSQQRVAKELFA